MIFDLIAGSSGATWTPADLFLSGEQGCWLDSSDLTTLFQNSTGTTPVTAAGQPVGRWNNKIAGQGTLFNVVQATTAARPLLEASGSFLRINFDGADDVLSSSGTTLTGQAVTLSVGFRKALPTSNNLQPVKFSGAGALQQLQILGADNSISVTTFSQTVTLPAIGNGPMQIATLFGQVNVTPVTGRLNGTPVVGSMGTTGSVAGSLSMPGNTPSSGQFAVSQVVLINRVLTSTEITKLEAFIGSKQ